MKKALIALIIVALASIIVLGVSNAHMFDDTDDQDLEGMQNMMNMMHGKAVDHQKMHQAMEKAIEDSDNQELKEMHESCEKMMGFENEE